MSDPQAVLEQLKNPDVSARKKAVFQAGEQKIPEYIPVLIDLLKNDSDNVVRNSAARALGKMGDPSQISNILDALEHALEDEDIHVKANACWSLGRISDPRVIPLLERMVSPDQRVYTMGAGNTGLVSETEASEKIKEEGMKSSDVIVEAVKALGNLKDPAGIPALIKAIGDEEDGSVRCAAALAMGKIGHESAVPHLLEALGDKYWYVKRDAAKALVNIPDPRSISKLVQKTYDLYDEVREYALKALVKIGKPAAVEVFKLFLNNPNQPEIKEFIGNELTKADVIQILTQLISETTDERKKEVYLQYLAQMQSN